MQTQDITAQFCIAATRKGSSAQIRIIGFIGFESGCEDFRRQVDALIAEGIKDVHLYINSPGGSCSDAAEIVNIMHRLGGRIEGEGGALVASAAAYIAMHCNTFSMPANGRLMLHKPRTCAQGTAQEIENTLAALKILEQQYYDVFKAKAKDIKELDKRWAAGDWWLTAKESKEQGFVTSVMPSITIDRATAAMLVQAGIVEDNKKQQQLFTNLKQIQQMEQIAKMLGLDSAAAENEVAAAITALQAKAKEAEELRTQAAAMSEKQIAAIVDGAVAAGKITADKKNHFADIGKTIGADALAATFEAVTAAVVKPTDVINKTNTAGGAKKWSDFQPAEIAALRGGNKAEYDRLYKEEFGIAPY